MPAKKDAKKRKVEEGESPSSQESSKPRPKSAKLLAQAKTEVASSVTDVSKNPKKGNSARPLPDPKNKTISLTKVDQLLREKKEELKAKHEAELGLQKEKQLLALSHLSLKELLTKFDKSSKVMQDLRNWEEDHARKMEDLQQEAAEIEDNIHQAYYTRLTKLGLRLRAQRTQLERVAEEQQALLESIATEKSSFGPVHDDEYYVAQVKGLRYIIEDLSRMVRAL
ncbi:hypothetical protein YB2330_003914 [Saitoella coloradoensis]